MSHRPPWPILLSVVVYNVAHWHFKWTAMSGRCFVFRNCVSIKPKWIKIVCESRSEPTSITSGAICVFGRWRHCVCHKFPSTLSVWWFTGLRHSDILTSGELWANIYKWVVSIMFDVHQLKRIWRGDMYQSISTWWLMELCYRYRFEFLSNQTIQINQEISPRIVCFRSNFKRNIPQFCWAIFQFEIQTYRIVCDDWFDFELPQQKPVENFHHGIRWNEKWNINAILLKYELI